MDWWHKMRRVWVAVSARVKTRKTGGTGGSNGGGGGGLVKLREDVRTCGYEDVQVMWNMLSSVELEKQQEAATDHPSKRAKQRPIWRIFFWSHHSP